MTGRHGETTAPERSCSATRLTHPIGPWHPRGLSERATHGEPTLLPLPEGVVDVYRLYYPPALEESRQHLNALTPEERARAGRIRVEAKRSEFVFTRAWLRRLLGAYLGTDGASVPIHRERHGKLSLAPAAASRLFPTGLQFNVSHSHGLALLAFAHTVAIGIDVEKIRPRVDHLRVARRFFSRKERVILAALPAAERERAFFRCWARKEAVIKGNGRGMALGLDRFDVSLGPSAPPRVEAIRWAPHEAARWRLFDLAPDPGYEAALAVRTKSVEIQTWAATE